MNTWDRLTSLNNELIPPEQVQIRARDVKPYHWAVWCTVGDSTRPFANTIVSRKWSEDGEKIWFMLDTHNFDSAGPDEMLWLVREDPTGWGGPDLQAKWEREAAEFEGKRPVKVEPMPEGAKGQT